MKDKTLCRVCKEIKETQLFVKSSINKTRERGLCKACKAISDKKYRETHKEEVAKYFYDLWRSDENRRKKNKLIKEIATTGLNATKYVKDKKCIVCNRTNKEHYKKYGERLHIHHVDNNGRHHIRLGLKAIHSNLVVVCRSCHVSLDNKNRDYTGRGYKIWETRRKNMLEKQAG